MNFRRAAVVSVFLVAAPACSVAPHSRAPLPAVAPATQPDAQFALIHKDVTPMYREMIAIDLPTALRIAGAKNLDLQQARLRYQVARGQYESNIEKIAPVIAPSMLLTHFDGTNQNASGTLVSAAFNDLLPGVSVQWILNPGQVVYDIIAARRRLDAADDLTDAALLLARRQAAIAYYDLVLAQARVSVARESLSEGQELLRIADARLQAGTGLPVDQLRAQTDLSARQQDLTAAINAFYQASVALTLTLHLDPSVTLVPQPDQVQQTTLVRNDLAIDALLDLAIKHRPDLQASQELVSALKADRNSVVWGGLGPQVQAGYGVGGIQTDNDGHTSAFHEQQRGNVGGGLTLALSTFGQAKAAGARVALGSLDVLRAADAIRAAVVSAHQESIADAALVPLAQRQLESASEALRLAQANLRAGTLLTVDVLQAQDALQQARLRHIEAIVHYNQSQVRLSAALGLLEDAATPPPTTQAAPAAQPGPTH